jgi:hypothetical protein
MSQNNEICWPSGQNAGFATKAMMVGAIEADTAA